MAEKLALSALYATSLSPRQKQGMLAAYKDYIMLSRSLENIVSRYKPQGLSGKYLQDMFNGTVSSCPWEIKKITPEAKTAYEDFVYKKKYDDNNHYCFVSVETAKETDLKKQIISAPSEFNLQISTIPLPGRIERYAVAYKKQEQLKDAVFIVNNSWLLTYIYEKDKDQPLADAFENNKIEKRFQGVFSILAELSDKTTDITEQDLKNAQIEALASSMLLPFENVLLSALTLLAEEENNVLKKLLQARYSENYFFQAENLGMITSAPVFQDYLNIRHLMHHRLQMQENISGTNETVKEKKASLHHRYKESYCRLCDKPLPQRIEGYIKAAEAFKPLVKMLTPNLLIREPQESNTKFVARAKKYTRDNPNAILLIESNYPYDSERKGALVKTISKILPSAEIIDEKGLNIDGFMNVVSTYIIRQKYLEVFEQVEYKAYMYALFHGRNIPVHSCWQYLRTRNIITPKEAEIWSGYKKMRNIISHTYLTPELNEHLHKEIYDFVTRATKLEDKLLSEELEITLVKDNIYRIKHKDGKVVEIDYDTKTVLNTFAANGKSVFQKRSSTKQPNSSIYTEEYPNGTSITLTGTEITSCRFRNGLHINFKYQKITFPDHSRLYLIENNNMYMEVKNAKLALNSSFRVLNYMLKNKPVNISKNEILNLTDTHTIKTGCNGEITSAEVQTEKGTSIKIAYKSAKGTAQIHLSDGSCISIEAGKVKLTHAGLTLTYQNRKEFVETYTAVPNIIAQKRPER